jgi:hypothetical protein
MLDALAVSKRKAPYQPRRKAYSRKSQTLGVPQQSWGLPLIKLQISSNGSFPWTR